MHKGYGLPVQVNVLPETRTTLQELAAASGLCCAAFIRQILEEYTNTGEFNGKAHQENNETAHAYTAASGS